MKKKIELNKKVFNELNQEIRQNQNFNPLYVKDNFKMDPYFILNFRQKQVGNICFSNDEKYMVFANFQNEINVYRNTRQQEIIKNIKIKELIRCVLFTDTYLILANKNIYFYNLQSFELDYEINLNGQINFIQNLQNELYIVNCLNKDIQVIQIFDLITKQIHGQFEVQQVDGRRDDITCLKISKDRIQIIGGSKSGYLRKWQIKTGQLINSRKIKDNLTIQSSYLDISNCGNYILSCFKKKQIQILDFKSFEPLFEQKTKNINLSSLFLQDSGVFLIGNDKKEVQFWNFENLKQDYSFQINSQNVKYLAISKNMKNLLTGSDDMIQKWEIQKY